MPWSSRSRDLARTRELQAWSHSPGPVAPGLWLVAESSNLRQSILRPVLEYQGVLDNDGNLYRYLHFGADNDVVICR